MHTVICTLNTFRSNYNVKRLVNDVYGTSSPPYSLQQESKIQKTKFRIGCCLMKKWYVLLRYVFYNLKNWNTFELSYSNDLCGIQMRGPKKITSIRLHLEKHWPKWCDSVLPSNCVAWQFQSTRYENFLNKQFVWKPWSFLSVLAWQHNVQY